MKVVLTPIIIPDLSGTNEIIMVSVQVPFYFQDYWSIGPVDKSFSNVSTIF